MAQQVKPKWADSKDIFSIYGISKRRLKKLREQRLIEHRKEGQKYLYLVDSVEAYANGTSVKPDLKKVYVDRVIPILKKEVAQEEGKSQPSNLKGGARMPVWKLSKGKDRHWYANFGDLTLEEYQGKRGIHYVVDFRQGNRRRTKSLFKLCGQEATSREEALAALALARVKLYEDAKEPHTPNSDQLTVSQYAPIYLREKKADRERSFKSVENGVLNHLEPYFGKMLMKDVRREHVKGYRDYRRRQGVKDISIWNNELCYLKEMFNLAIEQEIVHFNPVRKNKLKLRIDKRTRYMLPSEEEVIWPILKKHHPLDQLADLILSSAMRPANECDLRWEWIYFEEGLAIIPAEFHKQKTVGKYSLSDEIIAMLKKRKRMAEKFNDDFSYVFWREENGKRYKITTRWIQYKWAMVMAEAGIKDLHFYDLRHTCLSRLAAMGYNEAQLQSISNHESIISLARYTKPDMIRDNGTSREMLKKRDQIYSNGSNGNGKGSIDKGVEIVREYLY